MLCCELLLGSRAAACASFGHAQTEMIEQSTHHLGSAVLFHGRIVLGQIKQTHLQTGKQTTITNGATYTKLWAGIVTKRQTNTRTGKRAFSFRPAAYAIRSASSADRPTGDGADTP